MPKPGHGRIYGGIYACTGEVANEIAESMRRRRRTNNGDMVMSLVWPAERVILHECWQVVTMSAAAREMLMEKNRRRRDLETRRRHAQRSNSSSSSQRLHQVSSP